jgi:hypothetical protein
VSPIVSAGICSTTLMASSPIVWLWIAPSNMAHGFVASTSTHQAASFSAGSWSRLPPWAEIQRHSCPSMKRRTTSPSA